jgi:cell division protein FtsB
MHKVYIPIIVVILMACGYTGIQWQVTNSQLQASQAEVQFLTFEVEQLQIMTAQQQDEIQSKKTEIELKDIQINNLKDEVEEAKFKFYYASLAEQRYGVYDLEDYLSRTKWVEGSYIPNIFDCSEMSAYLEWKLENEGYHTLIVAGNSPSGTGRHAWLLVETIAGYYMPVEATTYSIVYWSNPYFDNYFVYDHQFETIQEALDYRPTEYDWWN